MFVNRLKATQGFFRQKKNIPGISTLVAWRPLSAPSFLDTRQIHSIPPTTSSSSVFFHFHQSIRPFAASTKSDRRAGGTEKTPRNVDLAEEDDEMDEDTESDEDSDNADETGEDEDESNTDDFDWELNANASDEELDDKEEFNIDEWLNTPGRDILDRGYVYMAQTGTESDTRDYMHISRTSDIGQTFSLMQDTYPHRDIRIQGIFEVSRDNSADAMIDLVVVKKTVQDYLEDYFGHLGEDLEDEDFDPDEIPSEKRSWIRMEPERWEKEEDARKKMIRRFEERMKVKSVPLEEIVESAELEKIKGTDESPISAGDKPDLSNVSQTMGYVYALTHPGMDGWVKIGSAQKSPEQIERRYDAFDPDDAFEVRKSLMTADRVHTQKWLQSTLMSEGEGVKRKNDWFEAAYKKDVAPLFKKYREAFPDAVNLKKAREAERAMKGGGSGGGTMPMKSDKRKKSDKAMMAEEAMPEKAKTK